MRNALVIFAAVALVVSIGVAAPVMDFNVIKDTGNDHGSRNANAGAAGTVRGAKNPWMEDTSYYDWDTAAIEDFINANGGVGMIAKVEFYLMPVTCPGQGTNVGINVFALQSGNDWAEGDGGSIWPAFNWSGPGGPAATYNNAQGYWRWNDAGTPADTSDDFKEDDPTQTLPWTNPVGGAAVGGVDHSSLRPIQNSLDWDPGDVGGVYYGVVLDPAVYLDIIQNPLNRGIILWDLLDAPHPDENWQANMRESGLPAYLRVTMVPEPASLLLIGLGGLGVLLRKKR